MFATAVDYRFCSIVAALSLDVRVLMRSVVALSLNVRVLMISVAALSLNVRMLVKSSLSVICVCCCCQRQSMLPFGSNAALCSQLCEAVCVNAHALVPADWRSHRSKALLYWAEMKREVFIDVGSLSLLVLSLVLLL